MRRALTVGALTLLLAGIADAGEFRVPQLREYRASSYTLLTDSDRKARALVPLLLRLDQLLSRVFKREPAANGIPTIVYVLDQHTWQSLFKESPGEWSDFVPGTFVNYLLVPAGTDMPALRRRAYHQYSHLFLHTRFASYLPFWFEEGVAGVMEDATFAGSTATIAIESQLLDQWVPLHEVFTHDRSTAAGGSGDYWQMANASWAIVHRGLIGDREFGGRMFRFLESVDGLESVDDAAQESFGESVDALDTEMHAYLRQRHFATAQVELGLAPEVTLSAARLLSERESLESIARMLLDTHRQPRRLAALVAGVASRSPDAGSLAVLRARMAIATGDDAGLATELAQLPPVDSVGARDLGLALLERTRPTIDADRLPGDRRAAWRQLSSELLTRALAGLPGDGDSACALATLAGEKRAELERTLEQLAAAEARYPDNGDVAACTAHTLDAFGEQTKLLPYLERVLRWSNDPAQRWWAAARLAEFREWQRANAPQ